MTGRETGVAAGAVIRSRAKEGDLLWTPGARWIEDAKLTHFLRWLKAERGLEFSDYTALWQWSTDEIEAFWQAIWDYFGIRSSTPYTCVLSSRAMPGARWFPGARLNYAEHALRRFRPGEPALLFAGEDTPLTAVSWEDFAGRIRIVATAMREMGVRPGDRVVAYVTNRPEAMIAMFAAVSIGAVWSSCSPDFGAKGAIDRLQQLEPKLLFCVDGYRYGGRTFDRRGEITSIAKTISSLKRIVHIPFGDEALSDLDIPPVTRWVDLIDRAEVPPEDFAFEQVAFDHPLWILFSSGTTGLPKAIVHCHGGVLIELLKTLAFHMDFHEGERAFFYTTTGWMMWNFLASMVLAGVVPILYDGNPAYPEPDVLWGIADTARASFFGASPAYVDIMANAGIAPGRKYDLSALRAVMPAGSPVSAGHTAWFYDNVKTDLWIATGSGGTDICTGLVGGVAVLPVYAGEIQARCLGVAARAFDDEGRELVDEDGELVVTQPMPSMPVGLWNDHDGSRYRASYFDTYPGVWRHGDVFRVNRRGGCFVLGRSDATLNRAGIRIGTAEIYAAVESLPFVDKALVVHVDLAGGKAFVPLFVKTAGDVPLDADMRSVILDQLRSQFTPRHAPDEIVQISDVPVTLTGKKLEVPIRRILSGAAIATSVNANAVANPGSLSFFADYARALRGEPPEQPTVNREKSRPPAPDGALRPASTGRKP